MATSQILEMARKKAQARINQWQPNMIITTDIQNISGKVWTDSFVAVNLHPHHCLSFDDWVENISSSLKTGETDYFWNNKWSYYDAMSSVWKKMTVTNEKEVISVIDCFITETPDGESPS